MKLRFDCNSVIGEEDTLDVFNFPKKAPVCDLPVSNYTFYVSLLGQLMSSHGKQEERGGYGMSKELDLEVGYSHPRCR